LVRVTDSCVTPSSTPTASPAPNVTGTTAQCESQDVLRRESIWTISLIVLGGLAVTAAGIIPLFVFCPVPKAFLETTGIFFWIHLFLHTATVGLTIAATSIDEMYKITVAIPGLWSILVKINFWRVALDATSLTPALDSFSESLDTQCCMDVALGPQIVRIASLEGEDCTLLRLAQSASILIVVLSFASVIALIAQRWCDFHLGGYVGRVIFGWSSIYSIVSVSLIQHLKSLLDDALPAAIFQITDSFQYTTGFYINVAAMAVKCVALVLVTYEVIWGHPCAIVTENDTEVKQSYDEDPKSTSALPDPNPAVPLSVQRDGQLGRTCCEASDIDRRQVA